MGRHKGNFEEKDLPSGKPYERNINFKNDQTWLKEYKHFKYQ